MSTDNGNNAPQQQGGGAAKILVPLVIVIVILVFYVAKSGKENGGGGQTSGQTGAAAAPAANFELVGSSGAAMTAALEDAVKNKSWIVVTGWTPHWMFNRWDLKYLEDPENVYGGAEEIRTIVRKGLPEEMPEVVKFLDAFSWKPEHMQAVMVWNTEKGADKYENALRWVKENDAMVEGWLEGIENRDLGKSLQMANVAWSSEIASANVVKAVLETRLGCECEITNTTAALMYESVAAGDQDFMAGAWLPTTQKDYYEKTKGKVVDLGANLVGTRIGLVVPAYVTIAGIGELADHADRFESEIIGIDPGAGIMQTTKKAIEVYGLK